MRKQHITYVLLAAQILLVNLGESLHRLPFFGFHDPSSELCCACECSPNFSTAALTETVSQGEESHKGTCPFCKFFEHYVASLAEVNALSFEHGDTCCVERTYQRYHQALRFYWSRGPPDSQFLI